MQSGCYLSIMRIALSHTDAFVAYRNGICDNAFHTPRINIPDDFVPQLSLQEALLVSEKYGTSIPLSCAVANKSSRRSGRLLTSKVYSQHGTLPAFIQLGRHSYIVSPELCALGLASKFDIVDITIAISELCSGYSPNSSQAQTGFRAHAPLSSLARMTSFSESLTRICGLPKLRKAALYAVEDAASPMESLLALLLSLPAEMGGYGLPKPMLNAPLLNKDATRKESFVRTNRPQQGELYGDLVFAEQNLIVEYASKSIHENTWDKDMLRINKLLDEGYKTVSIGPRQVLDAAEMNKNAGIIARQLNCSLPAKTPQWISANRKLREKLLNANLMNSQ